MKLKKAGIITKLVILVIIIYTVVSLVSIMGKTLDVLSERDALRKKAAELEIHNAELEYAVNNSTDDDVIADIARDELGLVGSDEKVFYDSNN